MAKLKDGTRIFGSMNVNTAIIIADSLNVAPTIIAAFGQANLAYATANGAQTWSTSAFSRANTANITADRAFGQANLAFAKANTANITADVAFGQANLAYATANGAQTWSVAAFAKANAALPNVNSTVLAGSLYLANTPGFANSSTQTSLSIAGDGSTRGLLTLFGLDKSRTTFQVVNSAAFSIQSVTNNSSGRHQLTLDSTFTLGSAGSGTIAGSQLSVWEANVWVGSVSAGPTVNAGIMLSRDKSIGFINLGNEVARFDSDTGNLLIGRSTSTVGQGVKLDVAGAINASAVLVNGSPISSDYSPAFAQANLAYATANGAQTWSVAAFAKANTANITADVGFGQANLAYATANGAQTWSVAAFAQANAAFNQANAAYTKANTGGTGGGGAYYQGNNGDVGSVSGLGDIFRVHTNILNSNVTIYSGNNAIAAGPLTINTGRTLTIQTNARVSIV